MFFLDGVSDLCNSNIPNVTHFLFNVVKYLVPIVIIILGTIDLFKAVIASKEDEIKAAQKLLLKRVIYGIVIFFLTTLVQVIFQNVGGDVSGIKCFFE